ncbi:MAG: DNA-binding response regulator [Rheinheimera sp.]|uniref:LytR/AlgR family response regulator transcription factor n=1 Tax=Arsukibacterium sp. UBA3155 TaxID=1946058 RepID=UPI000C8BC42B|nr:LytTR family DNA-binding domain-containing protein [Arsukibacterium sp. UBA3155]MAD74381.1 DNA-binding response regulator [Rheinheimera sp.]|tara:strand:+ start:13359 stop:14177 length:819 start_codon:yes stop_codon:yes gene_type:complete
MLKVIIVDDEPLARKGMLVRLAAFAELDVVAQCSNGDEAVSQILELKPDVVFLDVEMPGMDGFAVLKTLQQRQIKLPYIVFVTAYDHYAFNAFEVNALDYVLKPVEPERLKAAVEKVLKFHAAADSQKHKGQLAAAVAKLTGDETGNILQRLDKSEPVVNDRFPEAISIKDSGEITRVPVAEIDWVDAAGDYMCIHTKDGQTHILRRTMKELEQELDPRLFVRVHRSAIVNVHTIAKLQMLSNGEHQLMLTNGQAVKVSRSYKDRVKQVFSH